MKVWKSGLFLSLVCLSIVATSGHTLQTQEVPSSKPEGGTLMRSERPRAAVAVSAEGSLLESDSEVVSEAQDLQGVRYVKISQPSGYLQVGFVEVFNNKNVNVALGKATSSSQPIWPGTSASKAVNGAAEARSHPNLFHSGANVNSWWMVDLGSPVTVSRIVFYNRKDCCWDRAAHATIQLLDESQQVLKQQGLQAGLVQSMTFKAAAETAQEAAEQAARQAASARESANQAMAAAQAAAAKAAASESSAKEAANNAKAAQAAQSQASGSGSVSGHRTLGMTSSSGLTGKR